MAEEKQNMDIQINPNSVLPPAISAGSNLIGAGLQQIFYKKNADYNQKLQQENLKYQWENAIPETVNSMRAAGLNVGLANSNGGPSVSSSMGAGSVPVPANPLTGVGEILNQSRLISSQTFKNNAEGAEANIRALLTEKKTATEELEQAQLRLKNAKTEDERKVIQEEINLKQKQIEKIDNDIMNNNRLTESEVNLNASKAKQADAITETENKTRDAKFKSLVADARVKNASAAMAEFEKRYAEKYDQKLSSGVGAAVSRLVNVIFGETGSTDVNFPDIDISTPAGRIKAFWKLGNQFGIAPAALAILSDVLFGE